MGLLALAWRVREEYPLIVVANRDEFHARGTEAAHWWPEPPIWAGRDLRAGGTWFAAAAGGRFAAVTNVREPGRQRDNARSRGTLPLVALAATPAEAAGSALHADDYNGFNLVVGDPSEVWHSGNRASAATPLTAGVHALSNAGLDTPWPKVLLARERLFQQLSEAGDIRPERLFDVLNDIACPPDEALPDTGIGMAWERRLGSAFIVSPEYGTRSTTGLIVDADGSARALERSFDAAGRQVGETQTWLPSETQNERA